MNTPTNLYGRDRFTEQVCANCAGDEFLEAALVTSLRRCRVGVGADGSPEVDYVGESEMDASLRICCVTCGSELTSSDDLVPAGTRPRQPVVVEDHEETFGFDPSMVAMLRMLRRSMPDRFDALMDLVRNAN